MSRETDVVTAVFVGGPLDRTTRNLDYIHTCIKVTCPQTVRYDSYADLEDDVRHDVVEYVPLKMAVDGKFPRHVIYQNAKNRQLDVLDHLIGAYGKVYAFEVDDLIMSTAAYYLGRQTIQCHAFCDKLIESWDELPENVRQFVKRIVENAFHRGGDALGSDVDLRVWERVRKCWKEKP